MGKGGRDEGPAGKERRKKGIWDERMYAYVHEKKVYGTSAYVYMHARE
jgi:hypothetical protein